MYCQTDKKAGKYHTSRLLFLIISIASELISPGTAAGLAR